MAVFGKCFLLAVCFATALAATKKCNFERFGKLTQFNGEQYSVETECKSRLADFDCGIYRAVVTTGSGIDGFHNNRFTPDTLNVKLINLEDTTKEYVAYTSKWLLRKALKGEVENPWVVDRETMNVKFAGLIDSNTKQTAKLEKGPIIIELREVDTSGDEAGVTIRCFSDNFSSKGFDKTLCGDMDTANAVTEYKQAVFGEDTDITWGQAIFYKVLGDNRITQSSTCEAVAAQFQACSEADQESAARECQAIWGTVGLARCLAGEGDLTAFVGNCLSYVCDDSDDDRDVIRAAVNNSCPEYIDSVP